MRNWEDAVICEISFEETSYGGPVTEELDQVWFNDQNGTPLMGFLAKLS